MFGKFKQHKKKILAGVAVVGALAAYLVGDAPLDVLLKAILAAIGLI